MTTGMWERIGAQQTLVMSEFEPRPPVCQASALSIGYDPQAAKLNLNSLVCFNCKFYAWVHPKEPMRNSRLRWRSMSPLASMSPTNQQHPFRQGLRQIASRQNVLRQLLPPTPTPIKIIAVSNPLYLISAIILALWKVQPTHPWQTLGPEFALPDTTTTPPTSHPIFCGHQFSLFAPKLDNRVADKALETHREKLTQ